MLTDPTASKKYDASTAVSLVKVASAPNYAKFAVSTNTASDETIVEIRYRSDKPVTRRASGEYGSTESKQTRQKTFNVKTTHKVWDTVFARWSTYVANVTCTYDSGADVISQAPLLKDTLATGCFIPLTTALFAKLIAEEV